MWVKEYNVKKAKLLKNCYPAIPLLDIYPKEMKTGYWRDISSPMFIAALFSRAKIGKQPVPINRWMDEEDMMYIYNKILSSHEKEGNPAIFDNMGGPWRHYA